MGHGGWGGGGGFAGHYGGDGSYGPPMRSGPQLGPPGRWWDDHKMVKTLKLRPDQQRRMDDIFEASKPQLVGAYETFQREELRLAAMPAADLQDESKVFAGIDRVEQARATLEKESAHIILQIRHELDADQLARLDKELAENH
jgi:Spy/CpxP family protein refolding chaperone